ncbi:MAG: hypothetical protein ABSD59_25815 [Terracidiphilus sp.]|jgi:Na+-driven multidrug efflux pump
MHDPQQINSILAAVAAFYLIFYLFMAAVFIIPTWFIAKKAGMSPWLSLLCVFPLTGLILLYILAFAEWKVVPAAQLVPCPGGYPPVPPPYPPVPPTA